jgi:hypothetical protein
VTGQERLDIREPKGWPRWALTATGCHPRPDKEQWAVTDLVPWEG